MDCANAYTLACCQCSVVRTMFGFRFVLLATSDNRNTAWTYQLIGWLQHVIIQWILKVFLSLYFIYWILWKNIPQTT